MIRPMISTIWYARVIFKSEGLTKTHNRIRHLSNGCHIWMLRREDTWFLLHTMQKLKEPMATSNQFSSHKKPRSWQKFIYFSFLFLFVEVTLCWLVSGLQLRSGLGLLVVRVFTSFSRGRLAGKRPSMPNIIKKTVLTTAPSTGIFRSRSDSEFPSSSLESSLVHCCGACVDLVEETTCRLEASGVKSREPAELSKILRLDEKIRLSHLLRSREMWQIVYHCRRQECSSSWCWSRRTKIVLKRCSVS